MNDMKPVVIPGGIIETNNASMTRADVIRPMVIIEKHKNIMSKEQETILIKSDIGRVLTENILQLQNVINNPFLYQNIETCVNNIYQYILLNESKSNPSLKIKALESLIISELIKVLYSIQYNNPTSTAKYITDKISRNIYTWIS